MELIYDELCVNARKKVLKEFDNEVVVQKYIELYNKVLNDWQYDMFLWKI